MPRRGTPAQRGYDHRWQKLRLTILTRDNHTCTYCGRPARSVDHVIPKIEGGDDDPANLVAACISCNSRRAARWVNANRGRPKIFRGDTRSTPLSGKFASKPSHPGPTGALVD